MTTVRIALANIRQATIPDESLALACTAIEQAARQGAAIICFPEAYIPGYRTLGNKLPAPNAEFLERAWCAVTEAARASNIGVVLGTERLVESKPRLSALVIDVDGAMLGFQDKVQIDPSEEITYSPGVDRRVFRIGPLTFGIAICHEAWRYPETVRWAARRGARLVFHPHFHAPEAGDYRPTTFADPLNSFFEKAMLCRAAENSLWFASVNCAIEGSATTSAIVRPDGSVLAWQPYGVAGLLVADLDIESATLLLADRCKYA